MKREKNDTYGPTSRNASDYTARDRHGLKSTGALEQHSAKRTGDDAVRSIVLASCVSETRVETVVYHSNHAGGVAKEGSSPRYRVQDAVQPNLGRRSHGRLLESFSHTPCTSEGQRGEIGRAGTVTQVVGPSTRRENGSRAGEFVEAGVFKRNVVEGILVQAREGMELGGIRKGDL